MSGLFCSHAPSGRLTQARVLIMASLALFTLPSAGAAQQAATLEKTVQPFLKLSLIHI